MGNEETKKNDLKRTIEDGDSAMIPLCLDTNKLTVKWWLGKSMRTVKKNKIHKWYEISNPKSKILKIKSNH